ncbi:MAG TPA: hypothetical protein VMG59_10055 [Phycisphaerae bacterium]|nr:hypothetical protein [Phycisphaerae bacterium]
MNNPENTPGNTNGGPPPDYFVLRRVDFRSIFDFSRIFRAFRLSIEPPCLITALLAILVIYTSGRTLDLFWGEQVLPGEIDEFHSPIPGNYQQIVFDDKINRQSSLYQLLMVNCPNTSADVLNAWSQSPETSYNVLRQAYEDKFHQAIAAEEFNYHSGQVSNSDLLDFRRQQADQLLDDMQELRSTVGSGVFDAGLHYELDQFHALVDDTFSLVQSKPVSNSDLDSDAESPRSISLNLLPENSDEVWRSSSITGCLANMFITAPTWLLTGAPPMLRFPADSSVHVFFRRCVYLLSVVLFLLMTIACIAITGAVVCRHVALRIADKDTNIISTFRFALRWFGTFIKAPLLPFLTILGTGLFLMVLGLAGAVPFIGEIFVGVGFIIFLVGGAIIMLMVLGAIGGFSLIYPSVAVEGSDSFDAISRSFSYVYARPWRLLLYGIVALVYGMLTWLFLSFALYVMLAMTHLFLGWGMNFFGIVNGRYSGSGKLDTLWAAPTFDQLVGPINWWAMNWSESIGAMALYFWLFLVVSLLGAYMIAYFFSSSTIIYLLLRRHVDGQPMDEVYIETAEEKAPESTG